MEDFVNLLPASSHEDDPNLSGGLSGLHRVHCFSLAPRIIDVFEVPWIGPIPPQYQRRRHIRLYLDWIRKGDEGDHEEARAKAIDIVSRLIPPVDCWTDAETRHFDFLVDRQYWCIWRKSYPDHDQVASQFLIIEYSCQSHAATHLAVGLLRTSILSARYLSRPTRASPSSNYP